MSEINVLLQRIPVSKTFFRPENGSSQVFILPPPKGKLSQPILVDRTNREYNIHANERKYSYDECIHFFFSKIRKKAITKQCNVK